MILVFLIMAEILICSLSMLSGYAIDLVRSRTILADRGRDLSLTSRDRRAEKTWAGP